MIKHCLICGKEFVPNDKAQKFCGTKCYHEHRQGLSLHKKGKIKQCLMCGKDFYVPKHRALTAKYCSASCRQKDLFYKNFIRHEFDCAVCGKHTILKGHSGSRYKYCSEKCRKYAGYWFGSKVLSCIRCGKEFTINKGQQYRRKYCSRECQIETQRDRYALKVTARNGIKRSFKRKGLLKACQECGYDAHPEILGIHHKDKNPSNHSLDNLVVLCPNCHSLKHRKHTIN